MIISYHNTVVNSYDSFSCYLIKLSLDHGLLRAQKGGISQERDGDDDREQSRKMVNEKLENS